MRILVTGGAGYIGSHTVVELLLAGHDVVVLDNLSNGHAEALTRVGELAGRAATLVVGDILDGAALDVVFTQTFGGDGIDAVIHFAGLKAVGESVDRPLWYYENNVAGTLSLLQAMDRNGCRQLVFSSSCTVYGAPTQMPIREGAATGGTNPYGRTKQHIEEMLFDLAATPGEDWRIALLRYFNPVGAHESGRIGEDPHGVPNNLMPFVAQVAVGRRDHVTVHGNDYSTADGTGVRDYIHVVDLARAHLGAIEHLGELVGCDVWNIGTGVGSSVLEVIVAYERAVGRPIPAIIGPRRPGDAAQAWCDPAKALRDLGWKADKTLDAMCVDSWRWQSANPDGYSTPEAVQAVDAVVSEPG